ncbi:MAG TPA: peptidoglycan-binding protein, partial [Gemmatimonadota bacterium]|nr:peptidoglycan-binding protein [Gemmatimonadota bacterium]
MRFTCRPRILGAALAILLTPGLLPAQDVIGPAWEVRVVERVDAVYGVIREVVRDPSPAEILRVQIELARHGHDPGVRSGALDRPTRRALAAFQAARGLVICSCLSYETVVVLGIAPVVVAREGDPRRAAYGAVFIDPWGSSWSRYGYGSSVYYGHLPGGVRIGHDPYGRRVEHRPHPPARP